MRRITKTEEGMFLRLYIRDGYVLDFTNSSFNVFTKESIGEALQEKYQISKGKSLIAYLEEASDENREKLLLDLFHYYKENWAYEYDKGYKEAPFSDDHAPAYDERYAKLYRRCQLIVSRVEGATPDIESAADELKEKFSSKYLDQQIDLMLSCMKTNPTATIGIAKELVESCCKTILDELKIDWNKKESISQLSSKTLNGLDLLPADIDKDDPGAEAIKAILGNLRAIPVKLAEIRNVYGSGHGKSASFKGLEPRHAELAVGASTTFVRFIWETFEQRYEN